MAKLPYFNGATSVIANIYIPSVVTGQALTGIVFNSGGLAAAYKRSDQTAWTTITLVTATPGTYTSSGFVESDATKAKGMYELGVPNAAFASGDFVDIIVFGAADAASATSEYGAQSFTEAYPDGYIYFSSHGNAGSTPGINGTIANPCTVPADAVSLANALQIYEIKIIAGGDFICPSDTGDIAFLGTNYNDSLWDANGIDPFTATQSIKNCNFLNNNAAISNASGRFILTECLIDVENGPVGGLIAQQCAIKQLMFGPNTDYFLWHCYSYHGGILDFGGMSTVVVQATAWDGDMNVKNFTDFSSLLEIYGLGRIIFDATVTAFIGTLIGGFALTATGAVIQTLTMDGGTVDGFTAGDGAIISLVNVASAVPGTASVIDFGGFISTQSMLNCSGDWELANMDVGGVVTYYGTGTITLTSNFHGQLIVGGEVQVTNDSSDAVVIDINPTDLLCNQILGLVGNNVGFRNATYDGSGNCTSADLCVYDTAAHALTNNGATGLVHKYTIAASFTGTNMTQQSTRQIS